MSIADAGVSSFAATNGDATPAFPSTPSAGDLLLLPVFTASDDDAEPTISGSFAFSKIGSALGGSGSHVAGSGPRRVTVFVREADGSETSGLTVTVQNPGTGGTGRFTGAEIRRLTKTLDEWSLSFATGSDNSAGTGFSADGNTQLDAIVDDWLAVFSAGAEGSAVAYSSPTGFHNSLTVPGCTLGTGAQWRNGTSSAGDDCRYLSGYKPVSSGDDSGVPNCAYTMAASYLGGPAFFLRIREQATPVGGFDNVTVWDGASELPIGALSVWDGATELALDLAEVST